MSGIERHLPLHSGGTPEQRRLLLVAAGAVVSTIRALLPEPFTSLPVGWLLTVTGVAIMIWAGRGGARIPAPVARLALVALLGLAVTGATFAISSTADSIVHADSAACRDDATIYPWFAGQQLRNGRNPYTTFDGFDAMAQCNHPVAGTVVSRGIFQGRQLQPSQPEIDVANAAVAKDHSRPELIGFYDYGGAAAILLVAGEAPFVLLTTLLIITAVARAARLATPDMRLLTVIAMLAQVSLWGIASGHLDNATTALTVLGWLTPTRWYGGMFLGVACAMKPNPWLLVPAFIATAWRRSGRTTALKATAFIAIGYAVPSLPFFALDPGAFIHGNLGPIFGGLFPLGYGLIGLVTSGLLPPSVLPLFTVAPLVVAALAVWVVWRYDARFPAAGVLTGVHTLWVGTRSLLDYMAGSGLLITGVAATAPAKRETSTAAASTT